MGHVLRVAARRLLAGAHPAERLADPRVPEQHGDVGLVLGDEPLGGHALGVELLDAHADHGNVADVPPALGNGKLCYIEIPATDIAASATFYATVFGWEIRTRGDGATAFDDGVGQVSGTWVRGRPPQAEPGLLVYVMVDDADATLAAITANGGEVVQGIGGDPGEITARFRDPAGNLLGIYGGPAAG